MSPRQAGMSPEKWVSNANSYIPLILTQNRSLRSIDQQITGIKEILCVQQKATQHSKATILQLKTK